MTTWYDDMVVDVPTGECGPWRIERFEVGRQDALYEMLAKMQHGRGVTREGTYTGLWRGGTIVMSDTPDELRDHLEPLQEVRRRGGRVLIVGLGLGCLLRAVLHCEGVTHVDVVDRSPEVIALVGDHYHRLAEARGVSLAIHEADIFEQQWPPGTRWDVAWFDIWDDICEDNLPEMARLLRSYGRRADWKGCWGKSYIEGQRRQRSGRGGWW